MKPFNGKAMKQHKISWLNIPGYIPETWNPIVGCSKVSEGCKHCYAEVMARRLAGISSTNQYMNVIAGKHWSGYVRINNNKQTIKPYLWKKPRAIFVCSMGDLFHENASFEWINSVFTIMSDCDKHIYILLTKRPQRVLDFFSWKWEQVKTSTGHDIPWFPKDNIWFGVTAENQEQADKRIPILLKIPAKVRLVSCEPLLSIIDLNKWLEPCSYYCSHEEGHHHPGKSKLDWVIAGPENGPGARPMQIEWIENLAQQCRDAHVPFFDKKNSLGLNICEFPKSNQRL